jgi:ribosomal protein L11 methyltransferase
MIKSMRSIDFKGRKVLDYGTGTGILGILAEKSGAQEVIAIDIDDWSIANAIENAAVNGSRAVTVQQAGIEQITGGFDVILANINKHVLLANMAHMGQHLQYGGVVIMSGILAGDRQDIENAAIKNNMVVTEQKELNGWICVMLKGLL